MTSLYRKPTFSGVFTNFDSYIPFSYKSGLISLYRAYHQEIIHSKDIFKGNGYSSNFIHKSVKTFLDQIFIEKKVFSVGQKNELVCVLLHW